MDDIKRKIESGDEIRKILHSSGAVTPHLARLEEVASTMREVEWSMMRRTAAARAVATRAAAASAAAAAATAIASNSSNLSAGE
jgi:hypothetical protein